MSGFPIRIVEEGIDWPAWVQAVGSVVAIFVAIGIAAWQNHHMRKEQREVERKRDIVKLEASYAAVAEAATAAANIYDTCRLRRTFNGVSKRIMLEEALESIKRLPAAEAPDSAVVLHMALAKMQVSQLIPIMADFSAYAEEGEFSPEQIEFVKGRADRLIDLSNKLADLIPEKRRPDHIGLHDLDGLV